MYIKQKSTVHSEMLSKNKFQNFLCHLWYNNQLLNPLAFFAKRWCIHTNSRINVKWSRF